MVVCFMCLLSVLHVCIVFLMFGYDVLFVVPVCMYNMGVGIWFVVLCLSTHTRYVYAVACIRMSCYLFCYVVLLVCVYVMCFVLLLVVCVFVSKLCGGCVRLLLLVCIRIKHVCYVVSFYVAWPFYLHSACMVWCVLRSCPRRCILCVVRLFVVFVRMHIHVLLLCYVCCFCLYMQ